eukprot:TRINITY_DN28013_c0_g1_i1.p1 TRINITY_DN28013_c0_g1~~TRINITY_DN28013_c0_g1_i1.p1  ORF type:complete len:135 (+),score=8.53 TRINITY_DN28013_c0_g1_i1:208-612(+)
MRSNMISYRKELCVHGFNYSTRYAAITSDSGEEHTLEAHGGNEIAAGGTEDATGGRNEAARRLAKHALIAQLRCNWWPCMCIFHGALKVQAPVKQRDVQYDTSCVTSPTLHHVSSAFRGVRIGPMNCRVWACVC